MKTGRFANGIPFARLGEGNRKMVILIGGPGPMPSGFGLSIYTNPYQDALKDFTIFVIGRKEGMPVGYSTRNMASDCATVIDKEIAAPVDVVGVSYGGLIAPYLAVDCPGLVDHLVFASAAYRVSDQGKALDRRFAELQSQGRLGEAYATEVTGMYTHGVRRYLFPLIAHVMMSLYRHRITNPSDILIEAQAEDQHDCHSILVNIKAPTLVVAGDNDYFFPVQLLQETTNSIPNAKLVLLKGKGHGVVATRRFGREVLSFLRE
jgi:pimeloyl-ACP methyl ester carboxylesterase